MLVKIENKQTNIARLTVSKYQRKHNLYKARNLFKICLHIAVAKGICK